MDYDFSGWNTATRNGRAARCVMALKRPLSSAALPHAFWISLINSLLPTRVDEPLEASKEYIRINVAIIEFDIARNVLFLSIRALRFNYRHLLRKWWLKPNYFSASDNRCLSLWKHACQLWYDVLLRWSRREPMRPAVSRRQRGFSAAAACAAARRSKVYKMEFFDSPVRRRCGLILFIVRASIFGRHIQMTIEFQVLFYATASKLTPRWRVPSSTFTPVSI